MLWMGAGLGAGMLIKKHEKDRKNELASAKAEHEKNLAEISG